MKRGGEEKGKKERAMSRHLGRKIGVNIRQIFGDIKLFMHNSIYSE
jgi:hypothetical protein